MPSGSSARAGEGGTTLTELADTLVRDHGLPFRTAHAIAARLLKARSRAIPASAAVGRAARRRVARDPGPDAVDYIGGAAADAS